MPKLNPELKIALNRLFKETTRLQREISVIEIFIHHHRLREKNDRLSILIEQGERELAEIRSGLLCGVPKEANARLMSLAKANGKTPQNELIDLIRTAWHTYRSKNGAGKQAFTDLEEDRRQHGTVSIT